MSAAELNVSSYLPIPALDPFVDWGKQWEPAPNCAFLRQGLPAPVVRASVRDSVLPELI